MNCHYAEDVSKLPTSLRLIKLVGAPGEHVVSREVS